MLTVTPLIALVGSAPANAATTGPWMIHTYMDGQVSDVISDTRCVEVQGRSVSNSAQTQMYTCKSRAQGALHMHWDFVDLGNGFLRIRNVNSNKCLNVQGGSELNSAKVIQYTCGGSTTYNDQWAPVFVRRALGYDYYQLRNRKSIKCLNVQGASSANGADLIQFNCGATASQNSLFTWRRPPY